MPNFYRYTQPVTLREAQGQVADLYAQLRRDLGSVADPVALHAPIPPLLAGAWAILRETLVAGQAPRGHKKERDERRRDRRPGEVRTQRLARFKGVGPGDRKAERYEVEADGEQTPTPGHPAQHGADQAGAESGEEPCYNDEGQASRRSVRPDCKVQQ